MRFRLGRFSGVAPGVSPRLLADQFGQVARNLDFESGAIAPITNNTEEFTLQNFSRHSIAYYNDANWLEWADEDVQAHKGPVPNDSYLRFYWTGEDYPRMGTVVSMIAGSSGYPAVSYRLGIPAPEGAPGVSASGTPDTTEIPDTVSYVYTLVSVYGEEGPPSDPSASLDVTTTETVAISLPAIDVPSGNHNFGSGAVKRIYRSSTGSNDTSYQFVVDVSMATISYNDVIANTVLGEVMPSGTWIGPPDDNTSTYPRGPMMGLIPLANGVFAGFTGNRLCLSEPYLPHAWPVGYRITLDTDIVGIAAIGNGIVCMTNGTPYIATGVDPSAMTSVKVPLAQPCVNARSIVDMGEFVLYAGPDGLCSVAAEGSEIVTRGLISPVQWRASWYPEVLRAFNHEGTYVCFWKSGATLGGWVFDPRAAEAALSTLTVSTEVQGGYQNPKTGQLYLIVGNKIVSYRTGATALTATWQSKVLRSFQPVSMGWIYVSARSFPVTIKVYANGVLIADYSLAFASNVYTQTVTVPASISPVTLREPAMRLPPVVATEWVIEVSGTGIVDYVCIAQSVEELVS